MKGYRNRPEETAATIPDGWLRSGDLARQDEDGYLYIVDRKKDLIIRGGYNVYPREIEEVLHEHPAVALAAVVGVPDERLGEVGKAFVVLEPGPPIEPTDIVEWARDEMANFKVPRTVEFLDALPVNATGKVVKDDLRARTVPS
jgi:long-chain acyl-CoA synthetase